MEMYYVASSVRYVLVFAEDLATAWVAGHEALHQLHVELFEHTGCDTPVDIQIVRPATTEEMDDWVWDERRHAEELALEAAHRHD